MDYSWLQNNPSSVTPLPVYSPDFEFLQQMQVKADSQYETGLAGIKNEYASIFNRPVTGEAMTKRQQEYAKQAQDQMKSISASDVSDPKNQLVAQNIMRPFHDDKLLLQNIAYTDWYGQQFQKQSSLKSSKDKDERALYNPLVDSYLQNGLRQLSDAPLTSDAYSALEKRESIPVYDIDGEAREEWNKLFGKDGGIKTVNADGSIQVITTNGPKSVDAYKSFYLSVASRDKYAGQNRVIAIAKMENDMKDIKANNPDMSMSQINQEYGKSVIGGLNKYYSTAISSYRKTGDEWKAKNGTLIELDTKGNPLYPNKTVDAATAQQIKYNYQMAKQFDDLAKEAELEYTKKLGYNPDKKEVDFNSETYKKAVGDIAQNPRDYVSQVYLSHAADRWATGIAGVSSVEIKENPAWTAANKVANEHWNQQFKLLTLRSLTEQKEASLGLRTIDTLRKSGVPITQELLDQYLEDGFDSSFSPTTGFASSVGGSMGTGGAGTGTAKGPAIPSLGSGLVKQEGTDITHIKDPLEAHRQNQVNLVNGINNAVFSYDGFMKLVSSDVVPDGMKAKDVMALSSDLQNALVTGKYDMKPESIARREQFVKILQDNGLGKFTEQGAGTGPNQLRQGLMELAHKQADTIYQSADQKKAALGMQMLQQVQEVENNLATFNKNEADYKNSVSDFFKTNTDPEYRKLLNPATNLPYTAEEMSKDFPAITLKGRDGKEMQISPVEYASLWRDGSIGQLLKENTLVGVNNHRIENYNHSTPGLNRDALQRELNRYVHGTYTAPPSPGALDRTVYNYVRDDSHKWDNFAPDPNSIMSKYGDAGSLGKKMMEVGTKVMSGMPAYKDGISGSSIMYDISGEGKEIDPVQKATGISLTKELSPNNVTRMYVTDLSNKMMENSVDKKTQKDILEHLTTDEITNLVSGVAFHQYGPNGTPALELKLSSYKGDGKDHEKIGDSKVADIKSKGTIWVDIAPNAKGSLLSKLPNAQTVFKYGKILTGESVGNTDIEEKMGFKYDIIPGPKGVDGRSTVAYVRTSHWKYKDDGTIETDTNGNPLWTPDVEKPYALLHGENAVSPDELIEAKNKWMMSQTQKRYMLLQNKSATPPAEEGGVKIADLFK